jgi:replicative superfamily II helicase
MVDFRKRLSRARPDKILNPVEIYETLDRASDTGPLRPVQSTVLEKWHSDYREKQDVILKLHTGQGKTLVGLLLLKSKLNETGNPALYLCPNKFLVQQTCTQAKQFGIRYCTAEDDLPQDFIDGNAILITTVKKLFNGLTKFRTGSSAIAVSSIVIDDCHASIDTIRESFTIKLKRDEPTYKSLLELFSEALKNQGAGTFADISTGGYNALLPVPYWEWQDRQEEVLEILSANKDGDSVKFVWPILKDMFGQCQCVVSGTAIEIEPYLPPLEYFGTYFKASHRVFMSATVTDDSYLVRGLRLSEETVRNPLTDKNERWSGEKMILIPSLIDPSLDRSTIVKAFATPKAKPQYGIVGLTPSFSYTHDWEAYGSAIAKKDSIEKAVERLANRDYSQPLVLANRYDGVDLPDNMCRLLIFDSKPHAQNLVDSYAEWCRGGSETIIMRTVRSIEQGLGRSVRGTKDYCAIVITGEELTKLLRADKTRKLLSSQTRTQIEIGLEIASMAASDIALGVDPLRVLNDLIGQCVGRDEDWKEFYVEKMDQVGSAKPSNKVLAIFKLELEAATCASLGAYEDAAAAIQEILDQHVSADADKGWYIQELARLKYPLSKADSNQLQIAAHRKNPYLLKPKSGMVFRPLKVISQARMAGIIDWIRDHENFDELSLSVDDIVGRLRFGVKADHFEQAFADLGEALGFSSDRPDKTWKEGPDNLWCVRDGEYLLVECKNGVAVDRHDITKTETGQMNNACAWFTQKYPGAKVTRLMIIPGKKVARGAGFNEEVSIVRERSLKRLCANVRAFFQEFRTLDFKSLSETKVQQLVDTHKLSVDDLLSGYCEPVKS